MELILEFLGSLLADILFEFAIPALLQRGLKTAARRWRRRSAAPSILRMMVLVVSCAGLGAVSTFLVPSRILPVSPVPGISFILAPLVVGVIMSQYGAYRRRRGLEPELFATFWGGATCAFSVAMARWMLTMPV